MGRILIADDHDALRRGLVRGLTEAGHEVDEASNGNAAIERLHDSHFDVVLSDLRMGGSDGLDVLRTTKALHPTTAVILMTAFGSVTTAVEAMKSGAFDYVQKPFEIEEMEVKIEKALEVKRLKNQLDYLRDTQNDIYDFDRIIGSSPALQKVLDIVKKVAKSNTTVLIRGETGTLRVDVRLIAATNRDLPAMVQAGQFREDLYYRLNVVSIEMPPLRERKEDIVPLANAFIRKFAGELKKKIDGIEPEAQKMLMRYNWPGNIRELENTIERAMLLAEGRAIASGDLRLGEVATPGSGREQASVVKIPPTGIPLEDIERHALIEALKMSNWVQKDAAELLSISPRVMNYKIKTLGIEFPRGRRAAPAAPQPPPQTPPIAVAS